MTAGRFIEQLTAMRSDAEYERARRFFTESSWSDGNEFIGVRMGSIFALAKSHNSLPLPEIEELLESQFYDARMGAVSIMDFQARGRRTSPTQRQALCELYLRRHDRINNWDLIDRAAPHVVGQYLADKDRSILHTLARSANPWERRTAIVAPGYFIMKSLGVEETFTIAEILIEDQDQLMQRAVGSWLRFAGQSDEGKLIAFLDRHAARMPGLMRRLATAKLTDEQRAQYRPKR